MGNEERRGPGPDPSDCGIQQVQRPVDVHVAVKMGILDRDSNAGHRRQMDDSIDLMGGKKIVLQGLSGSNVSVNKRQGFP